MKITSGTIKILRHILKKGMMKVGLKKTPTFLKETQDSQLGRKYKSPKGTNS